MLNCNFQYINNGLKNLYHGGSPYEGKYKIYAPQAILVFSGRSRADFVAIIKEDVLGMEARRTTTRGPTSLAPSMATM